MKNPIEVSLPREDERYFDWMAFYEGERDVIVRRPLLPSRSLLELVEEGTLSREAVEAMISVYGQ